MPSSRLPYLSSRLQGFGTTVFAEMTQLATLHSAVNLGQGFPNFEGPAFIKDAAIQAIEQGHNQYCRSHGVPELTAAVADHQQRAWGLSYDPEHEVTIYNGATEAIAVAIQALCQSGDEVVVFEPFYDSYRACIAMAGAVERLVPLQAPDFHFDQEALRAAITPKTRAILLNSPHNPTGKVFSRSELTFIANLCVEANILALCDEVYEHLVFDGEHIPLASLPGMRERTVVISSAGKTFSYTGWKIGTSCAPPALTRALRTAHQFVTFCTAPPFQYAMAKAYRSPASFFRTLTAEYQARRDRLCDGLDAIGFDVMRPAGTYFAVTDIRALGYDDDVDFCRMLPETVGVAAIPTSAFYGDARANRHLVRWAFCKTDALLDLALQRLQSLKNRRQ